MMGWLAGWINTSQHLNEVCYTSSAPDTPPAPLAPLGHQPAPALITLITANASPPIVKPSHSQTSLVRIVIVLEVSGQDRQHWNVASWVKTRLIVFLWWRWMTFIRPVILSRYKVIQQRYWISRLFPIKLWFSSIWWLPVDITAFRIKINHPQCINISASQHFKISYIYLDIISRSRKP